MIPKEEPLTSQVANLIPAPGHALGPCQELGVGHLGGAGPAQAPAAGMETVTTFLT